MKRPITPFQTFARACALSLAIATCAHAADITVIKEPTLIAPGLTLSLHPEQGTQFKFSEMFLGASSIFRTEISAIAPGTATTTKKFTANLDYFTSATLDTPVAAISGTSSEPDSFATTGIQTEGGLSLKTKGSYITPTQQERRNPASTGGSLDITHIEIDLTRQVIRGDITGANGVGSWSNLDLWHFTTLSGVNSAIDTQCNAGMPTHCWGELRTDATLNSLHITSQAFDIMSRSLGLTAFGISALQGVTDYGTVVVGVPEPSAWMMLGAGLVGVGVMRRRRPAHH